MSINYFEKKEPKRRIRMKKDPYLLSENERKAGSIKKKQEKNRKESIKQSLEENDFE